MSWALAAGLPAAAGPVADALERPALVLKNPRNALVLSAARAGQQRVVVGERGVILRQAEARGPWQQVASPVSTTLTTVRFADDRHGVAVGHGGAVLVTRDGGQQWTLQLDGRRLAKLALEAAQAGADPVLLRDAERLVADGPDKPFLDAHMWDAQRLLVVGAYGIAMASDNGGVHWTSWMGRLPNPRGNHLYAVRQRGERVLIAGEQGLALLSVDGGNSFKALKTPYAGSWFTAEMLADDVYVLAGLRGNVWMTRDGGGTWAQMANPMPASIVASARDAQGQALFVNQAGFVLALSEQGLRPVNKTAWPTPTGVLIDGSTWLALGAQGPIELNEQGERF
ncbi:WD40/YVTN/BNR-like repeat-containing protein [Hydrogenophaga sp. OTU3427]|uniref:WD40/YVTN/BNR-like repeat-containing protein n=1 Tax=Hydrogenophaga sp. OTU3427 TaxID=3043856 RepID=UPI00313F198A